MSRLVNCRWIESGWAIAALWAGLIAWALWGAA